MNIRVISVILPFSLRKEPVNEHPKNVRKEHVNGEKLMVATEV